MFLLAQLHSHLQLVKGHDTAKGLLSPHQTSLYLHFVDTSDFKASCSWSKLKSNGLSKLITSSSDSDCKGGGRNMKPAKHWPFLQHRCPRLIWAGFENAPHELVQRLQELPGSDEVLFFFWKYTLIFHSTRAKRKSNVKPPYATEPNYIHIYKIVMLIQWTTLQPQPQGISSNASLELS